MEFEVGQRVGDYEIVGVPHADVPGGAYRVRNTHLDRAEDLIVLLPDITAQPDRAARLVAESRAIAGLDHPNIAQIYATFPADNRLLMTREPVEGLPLDQLEKQLPIAYKDAVRWVSQVLSALSYAHSHGVIHGHLRPADITVSSADMVKLTNFGSGGAANDPANPAAPVEALTYMSPEQAQGANADERSDLYSVGIVLYELLAGRRPFTADTAEGLLDQERNTALQAPVEINPALPPLLSDIVFTALAKNPLQRFQNANAFRNALQNALQQFVPCPSAPPPAAVEMPVAAAIPAANAAEIPPAVAAPVFENVAIPSSALPPKAASGHRGLWISLGAIAALAILIAAALALPHFLKARSTATNATNPPALQIANNPSSATATVSASPATQTQPDTPANPAANPVTMTAPAAIAPPPVNPIASGEAQPNSVAAAKAPRPSYSPKPPPPPNLPAEAPAAAPSAPAGPTDEEVEQAGNELAGLNARAGIVSASVERLRSEQNADGLDLRQDMAGAYARMNTDLRTAATELESRNISAARSQMDRADKEITTLEGLFRR